MIEHCFHDKLSFAILIHLSTCPFSSRYVDSIIKGCGKQVSSFAAFKNDPNLSLRLIPYFFVFPLFLFFFFFLRTSLLGLVENIYDLNFSRV